MLLYNTFIKVAVIILMLIKGHAPHSKHIFKPWQAPFTPTWENLSVVKQVVRICSNLIKEGITNERDKYCQKIINYLQYQAFVVWPCL